MQANPTPNPASNWNPHPDITSVISLIINISYTSRCRLHNFEALCEHLLDLFVLVLQLA